MKLILTVLALLLAPSAFAQVDRSAPPLPGPPPLLDAPEFERFVLSNGLEVVLMEKHQVPLVQLTLLVRTGSVDDPAGKSGLASLTLDMMDEGAGGRDALALADAIDFLGASLSTGAGLHTASVDLFTPLSKLAEALPLMADVALRPDFSGEELERLRVDRLTDLVQAHDEPNAIAAALYNRTLFGADHPYGIRAAGTEASLRGFTAADLQQFHRTYFHTANASLVVVGDVTRASIEPALTTAFGSWPAGENPKAAVTPPRQVKGRTIYLVDKPGAAQSVIRIGRIGAARDTEDYYAMTVLNTILGGSFSSRLNQNLREDKGYSYGAGSSFGFRPVPGPFLATASVQTDVTGPALAEFMKELRTIRNPIPADELDRAKNYEALQYPQAFQTVGDVAGQIEDLLANTLPEDHFDTYQRRILAVTAADVQRAARKYIDPDNLAIVVVGDRSVIEEQIKDMKLGKIEYLSVEDVLGPVPAVE
ncbi:MAG: pitrilysin family protein [Rhodothermales bacterium]|nr:pitrilysin family protein [Rhodothermales bacterium]